MYNDNNNEGAPVVTPGSDNKMNSAVPMISHIPLPQWKAAVELRHQNGEVKWRCKFEDSEKKRKALLTQSQKCERELAELGRRYQLLCNEHISVKKQLAAKDAKLAQLQEVSERMYREYEALKSKHDVQSRVMEDAMKSASQWYMQNRELKRKSAVLAQRCLKEASVSIIDIPDEADTASSTDGDLDNLMKTIKELTDEVGQLQAELSATRLQEFEAQEQSMSLAFELEEEKSRRARAETELHELRMMKDNLGRVSRLVATEMTALREQCQHEKEEAQRMKLEADEAQKERNVLKHQSTLLMADVIGDGKLMRLLQEVEVLKRTLEEEQQRHMMELQELQDKLDEREAEAQLELMEEKLRLAESELHCALQRAEQAEKRSSQMVTRVNQLQDELEAKACLPPPPPPPPPPLPPPPLAVSHPRICTASLRQRNCVSVADTGARVETGNPVLDMANMLGIPRRPAAAAILPGGAIDDIINQIKGGKFTLKATEKQKDEKKEEPPAAVQEMLYVLGTLKRRHRSSTQQSRWPPPADIAL
ncbi:hypothetical protein B7P43_G05008 [Cryptotermes secundus]|uniref:Uncharacterized protein n=1 Tax=Cryptotermes secundus TaxID=105785 RepID=A0A2J7PQU2_9NEOP|nr:hypothetical protein B7P43_G05008 [Cryptotermes secundus]PNF18713.1 hypothetical protein B7P43_G05008 [Cryptotermes secundus]PNF18714.1 hypothetical protein B7P43_G05008 [Cryptotermes secundus]